MRFVRLHPALASMVFASIFAAGLIALLAWPQIPHPPVLIFEPARSAAYTEAALACETPKSVPASKMPKAAEDYRNCLERAEEYRLQTNDLIQQTRAASAAESQVNLQSQGLWLAFLQTIGGVLTLIAASGAAVFARDAAIHSRRSADISSRIEDASLVFSFKKVMVGKSFSEGDWFGLSLTITNVGRSAARIHSMKLGATSDAIVVERTISAGKSEYFEDTFFLNKLGDGKTELFKGYAEYSTPLRTRSKWQIEAAILNVDDQHPDGPWVLVMESEPEHRPGSV